GCLRFDRGAYLRKRRQAGPGMLAALMSASGTPAPRSVPPLLFLTAFLDIPGFGMILPLLPFYAQRYGADPLRVGALFACYSLAQALCAPVLGRLSDRFRRRTGLLP